jgi:predicted Zn-dependent protease
MTGRFDTRAVSVLAAIVLASFAALGEETREVSLSYRDMCAVAARYDLWVSDMGLSVVDSSLIRYMVTVGRRVRAPAPSGGAYRLLLLRDSEPNAFSFANGSIHVSVGLLHTIRSEAQLALLIAHEIAHVSANHHMQRRYELHARARETMRGQLAAFIIFGGGIGDPGAMIMRAMSGFSRRQEYEADSLGLLAVARAGYDPTEAVELFRRLNERFVRDSIVIDPALATHPDLTERYGYCRRIAQRLAARSAGGETGSDSYAAAVQGGLTTAYRLCLQDSRCDDALDIADYCIETYGDSALYIMMKADAFVARGRRGDANSALCVLREAGLAGDTGDPRALRSMGLALLMQGEVDSARVYLREYRAASPEAPDSAHVRYYIEGAP